MAQVPVGALEELLGSWVQPDSVLDTAGFAECISAWTFSPSLPFN